MATPSDPRPPSFLRRIPIDVEPLRVSHDFRLIWSGLFISELGYQFTLVAIFVQVYALTGSAAAVGLTGLFSFLALVLGSVISGAVVDAYDRRTLLMQVSDLLQQIEYGTVVIVMHEGKVTQIEASEKIRLT